MNTRRNHKPHTSIPPKSQSRDRVLVPNTQSGRVLVIETLNAAEDVIRVSIEPARAAWQPERVIVF